jgi:long-chain acyl-CoA synthetase
MAIQSIVEGFFKAAEKHPDKVAIIWKDERITYQESAEKVNTIAAFLLSEGVEPGDRVVFYGDKKPLFAFLYLAIHSIKAVAVPVDVKLPLESVSKIIQEVEPKIVFHPKAIDSNSRQFYFEWQVFGDQKAELKELPNKDDLADILFTTGTTGAGKGVQLTHLNILAGAQNSNQFIGNDASDTEIIPLPLHHAFGLRRLRTNLMLGATVILIDGFMFPKLFFDAIQNNSATGLCMVPAGFSVIKRLMKDQYKDHFNRLKYIEFGSSKMNITDKLELIDAIPNTRICMHYGLTEVASNIFIEFNESANRLDALGKPSPNVEIGILDEAGSESSVNTIGEISVKGDIQTPGYWKNIDLTKKAFINGWFKTGDLGYIDEEGYIILSGRNDDVMNIGGKKVFPSEIEDVLINHPEIRDCACIAIADEKSVTGEHIKAFIVLMRGSKFDQSNYIKFLSGKIEPYKIPVYFEPINKIPTTTSGKKQREKLKTLK